MSISDRISTKWNASFWEALGCGMTEEQADQAANRTVADLVNLLHRVERAQAPQTPRHQNLAGRRQAALRQAR